MTLSWNCTSSKSVLEIKSPGNRAFSLLGDLKWMNVAQMYSICHMRKGFALLEALLTVAALAIIGTLSVPLIQQWQFRSDLNIAKTQVMQGLQTAKQFAVARKNDSSWSFFISGGVVFPGSDYESVVDDPAQAANILRLAMPETVRFEGLSQVTFDSKGTPNTEGTIILTALNNEQATLSVVVAVNANSITLTSASSSSAGASSSASSIYTPPVCSSFTLGGNNVITMNQNGSVTYTNLAALRTSGGIYVPTYDCESDDNGNQYERMFQNGNCQGSINGWGNAVTPGGGESRSVSYSNGNLVVIRVRNYLQQTGYLSIDDNYTSKDQPERFRFLRDGESLSFTSNSAALQSVLQASGYLDGSNLVNLGNCEMILATEMETPYVNGDYIDSVIKLQFP